jgi:putative flavoprotein involved in K+ transport
LSPSARVLQGANGGKLQFSGSLRAHCAMADLKLTRLLGRIDDWIDAKGLQGEALPEGQGPAATHLEDSRVSVLTSSASSSAR